MAQEVSEMKKNERIDLSIWQITTVFGFAAAFGVVLYMWLAGSPAPSAQKDPSVAYLDAGSTGKEAYLVVWTDLRWKTEAVAGAIISPRSAVVNENIPIATNPGGLEKPVVAANTTKEEFLVLWEDQRKSVFKDVYAQRVGKDGSLIGTDFPVSTAVDHQENIAVSYNSTKNQYLVVWQDSRSTGATQTDIYGQFVSHDGKLIGGNFAICVHADDNYRPAVAYNATDDEFLVVWQDYRPSSGTDIYGRRVSSTGTLSGNEIVVSSGASSEYNPDVAYLASGTYLVVWDDWRNFSASKRDVYAQLVTPAGALSGGNFAVSTASGSQGEPSVASGAQGFLVTFDDGRNKSGGIEDIYAQLVKADGTLSGTNFVVTNEKSDKAWNAVAYAAKDKSFLVVWQDWRDLKATDTDIYGHHVDAKGTIIQPPASDENFAVSVPGVK
jgi:hypothetical protein